MVAERLRIAIIGGGFSGVATAIHLSRGAERPLEICIIEPRAALGMGLAHSAPDADARLNGPDAIHAPYPDAPEDFALWMRRSGALARDPQAVASDGLVFPRRLAFGHYMQEQASLIAASNASASRLTHAQDRAVRLRPEAAAVQIELASGARLRADHCVLALGWNEVGVPRELSGIVGHRAWFGHPWDSERFAAIRPQAAVLLVGSGLSACDTFAALVARGHQGPVYSIARRGLRPASQNPQRSSRSIWARVMDPRPPVLEALGGDHSLRHTVRTLRRQAAAAQRGGASWHLPFDEFRDAAHLLWPAWSVAEQQRYLRHAKSWYDAFRFRNPPQVQAIVQSGVASRQLQFLSGRLRAAQAQGMGIHVHYEPRGGASQQGLSVEAVINCTGPQPRPSASANPLWRQLLADGLARDSSTGLGVDVDTAARLIDAQGRAHQRLFAVGPPTMGRFGEVVAVPFIVRGILDLARRLA